MGERGGGRRNVRKERKARRREERNQTEGERGPRARRRGPRSPQKENSADGPPKKETSAEELPVGSVGAPPGRKRPTDPVLEEHIECRRPKHRAPVKASTYS